VLPTLGVVAVGGALGAVLRASLSLAFPSPAESFPWTTFAINVGGSLALALLTVAPGLRGHSLVRPFLGAGLLGGFTTMSTAAEDTRALLASGHETTAAAYVLGTLTAALVAVHLVRVLAARENR
jgi:CrcB protein